MHYVFKMHNVQNPEHLQRGSANAYLLTVLLPQDSEKQHLPLRDLPPQ
jgi:hypothetical protein